MTGPATTDLLELLRSGPAEPRDGDERIWDITPSRLLSTPAQREALRGLRSSVLTAMATCGLPVFLLPPDDPPDAELAHHLRRHAQGAWEVAGGAADAPAMHAELEVGGWTLYTAPEPVRSPVPDAFTSSPEELVDFMRRNGMTHFVASFHDDIEWVVGLLRRTS